MDALDCKCSLIDERIEQAALVRGQKRAGLVAVDANHADGAPSGAHRQKEPLCSRKRVGAATRRPIVLPCPSRRGEISLIEKVLGGVSGLDLDGAVVGKQQDDADFQHERDLIGRGPEHVIECAHSGKLAAEHIKRLGSACPAHRGQSEAARPRRDIGHDDGHDGEEQDRHHVARVGDREGVIRFGEEEIVAERRRHAGEQRGPQAEAHGDADNRGQEDEVEYSQARSTAKGSR